MRSRRRGFVLLAVLAGLLLIAAIIFALLFLTTLDTLAARSAQRAVLEEAQLQGALDLAGALVASAVAAGEGLPFGAVLGPWPEHGLAATVEVTSLASDDDGSEVLRLEARLTVAGDRAPTPLIVRFGTAPLVLWRP